MGKKIEKQEELSYKNKDVLLVIEDPFLKDKYDQDRYEAMTQKLIKENDINPDNVIFMNVLSIVIPEFVHIISKYKKTPLYIIIKDNKIVKVVIGYD